MKLDFKPVVAGDIEKLKPFYGLRPNKACDSVFLDCFLWKDIIMWSVRSVRTGLLCG